MIANRFPNHPEEFALHKALSDKATAAGAKVTDKDTFHELLKKLVIAKGGVVSHTETTTSLLTKAITLGI